MSYPTIKKDIREEDRGEKHYKSMSRKNPRYRTMLKGMARDEERHEENLEKIAKTKALKKRTKDK